MLLGMQRYVAIRRQSNPVVQNQSGEVHSPADENDDEAVIVRVLGGDRNAYRLIIGKYGARVLAFCRARMSSVPDAEDAAQEVFVRAYKSLASFKRGENFSSWLFAIAANNVRTHIRIFMSRKMKERAFARERMVDPADDPKGEAERKLESGIVRQAVSALPIELRESVELYYFAQLSVEETAQVLRLSQEAVKSRLFRARKRLREVLEISGQPTRSRGGIDL